MVGAPPPLPGGLPPVAAPLPGAAAGPMAPVGGVIGVGAAAEPIAGGVPPAIGGAGAFAPGVQVPAAATLQDELSWIGDGGALLGAYGEAPASWSGLSAEELGSLLAQRPTWGRALESPSVTALVEGRFSS